MGEAGDGVRGAVAVAVAVVAMAALGELDDPALVELDDDNAAANVGLGAAWGGAGSPRAKREFTIYRKR